MKEHLKTAGIAVGVALVLWLIAFGMSFLLLAPKRFYESKAAEATKVEAQDSLRRRAKKLTDDIELFLSSRKADHPP